jgi:hypothetical protein
MLILSDSGSGSYRIDGMANPKNALVKEHRRSVGKDSAEEAENGCESQDGPGF